MSRSFVTAATAAVLGVTLLAGCGGGSSGGSDSVAAGSSPSASASTGAGGCGPVPTTKPAQQKYAKEPKLTIAPTTYTATITTNCGTIVVKLDGKHAPHTVNSFAFLAGKHYFDNTPCHRLTTSGIYVLQCGDPTGTGTGGPGYQFKDENLKGATYPAGTVAMANAGPGTNGSQFFFVYANTRLAPSYTPFGTVVSGLDTLKKIAAAGSNPPGDGAPVQPVVIESFRVTKGAPATP
jgi:peptidyl-prolyl cis-trans isomerase B (cyclophilin B)